MSKTREGPSLFYLVKPVGVKQTHLCESIVLPLDASFHGKHLQGFGVLFISHF